MGRFYLMVVGLLVMASFPMLSQADETSDFLKFTCIEEASYVEISMVKLVDQAIKMPKKQLIEKYNLMVWPSKDAPVEKWCLVNGEKFNFRLVASKIENDPLLNCERKIGVTLNIFKNDLLLKEIPNFWHECNSSGFPQLIVNQWNIKYCHSLRGVGDIECDFKNIYGLEKASVKLTK